MDSSHGPISDSSVLIERTGIPRKVLSRLLGVTKIGVGYHVLDVGCGRGHLAAYFTSLGIRCTGTDESPSNVMEARRAVPACDFTCTSISDSVSGPKGGFDLVLVRELSQLQSSLLSPATLSVSLQFLSHVRPGGCLAFLARVDAETSNVGGHRPSCFAGHTGWLPGDSDLFELPDGPMFARSLRPRRTGQDGSGYAIALLRMPPKPLSQDEWRDAAKAASHATAAPCCQWAARDAGSAGFRSKAA